MTGREPQSVQTTTTDAPVRAAHPVHTAATLNYSNLPSRPPHVHAVRHPWLLALMFWAGAISACFFILSLDALIATPKFAGAGFTRFLVLVGQSTLIASFTSFMFVLAITGKVFRSHRQLIRYPLIVAFVIGAAGPGFMAICVVTLWILRFSPINLLTVLMLFGLATIYPMFMAHWLGHRVE